MENEVRDAIVLLQTAPADALELASAAEIVKAWADARQLQALRTLAEEQPAFLDDTGRLIDPATAEAATALTWSTRATRERVDLAHDLCDGLPDVLAALRAGVIDLGKAREISHGTCELEPAVRKSLAKDAIEYAGGHTRGQLRAWLARRIARIDPEAADRKHRRQVKKRCVRLLPEADGMATISAYLSAEEAQAVWASLRVAAAGVEGGMDAANADAFIALLTGTRIGTPVPVTVLLTGTGDEIAGYGPISQAHAATLCDSQPVIHLAAPRPSVGYRPAPAMARWVRARHRHCRFPGCRRPAAQCDLDHVTAWPTGSTHAGNLAPLCRYHHRLKTHADWQVRLLPGGDLRWTSPRGRTYTTHLHDP
jgi:hypothetical protein